MIKSLEIKNLFDFFDYHIEFKEGGITILTGPNGYGKTTILRILHALATENYIFLIDLAFDEITLSFSDSQFLNLKKHDQHLIHISNGSSTVKISKEHILRELNGLLKETSIRQIDNEHWIDRRTDLVYDMESILEKFPAELSSQNKNNLKKLYGDPTAFPRVYFIQEQRLLRRVPFKGVRAHRFYPPDDDAFVFSETIEEYSKELTELFKTTLAKYSQVSQQLDSSFPRRLFDETGAISEAEFKSRFEKVQEVIKLLRRYKLFDSLEENQPTYKEENAKALLVYLDDTEKKLKILSDLLERLDTFTDILNQRRFTFKQIAINKEQGIQFITEKGYKLGLSKLSSGEQQEVVLLYELLFKIEQNTLVLIDEPEISLHVAWQKEFLHDLAKVIDKKNINVVVATHSPQIINEDWDLTVDLEEIAK